MILAREGLAWSLLLRRVGTIRAIEAMARFLIFLDSRSEISLVGEFGPCAAPTFKFPTLEKFCTYMHLHRFPGSIVPSVVTAKHNRCLRWCGYLCRDARPRLVGVPSTNDGASVLAFGRGFGMVHDDPLLCVFAPCGVCQVRRSPLTSTNDLPLIIWDGTRAFREGLFDFFSQRIHKAHRDPYRFVEVIIRSKYFRYKLTVSVNDRHTNAMTMMKIIDVNRIIV